MGDASRTDWGAVFAGAVLATAIALVLLSFGAALGLSISSPYEGEGAGLAAFAVAAGLWVLWIQLVSFSCGGYVAGRLRARRADETEHESDVRDGMHGLMVWGVGVIAAVVISVGGLSAAGMAADAADKGSAASIARAATDEVNQGLDRAAAEEPQANPEAVDETLAERRAEVARKLSILAAFTTAASVLAGAAAAFFAAFAGGNHRDRSVKLAFFISPSRRVATPPTP
jgi:hypothetical protein